MIIWFCNFRILIISALSILVLMVSYHKFIQFGSSQFKLTTVLTV